VKLDVKRLFKYYPPEGDQPERYERINDAARAFAVVVQLNTQECAEQTLAIRDIQRARIMANAAVALGDNQDAS
jgi:hypothetical protein